ncbi:MAG: hypothetical protein H8E47_11385, partial [Anaerolineales bacterium]|nr:hypothetical protein [Anaerolineales bacterium]
MTSKERMFRALQGGQPDVVPAAPAYPGLFLVDFERAFYVEQYRLLIRGRSRYPIDHGEDTRFRVQAKYQSYGIFKTRPDWIEISRVASRAWAEQTDIVLQDGILFYEDKVSGVRLPMHEAALPRGDRRLVAGSRAVRDLWDTSEQVWSKEQVDARLPILSADELLARGDFDLARQVVADYGDQYFISTILDTPFSDAYDLLGFQGLMLIQHDRPDL